MIGSGSAVANKAELEAVMAGHIIAYTKLVGTYQR